MRISHNYLIILIVLLITQGCNVLHKVNDIAGNYSNKWYDTQHELILRKDNSFIFFIKEGLLTDTIKGKWSIEGKQLSLEANNKQSSYKAIKCDTCNNLYLEVYDSRDKEKLIAFYKAYVKGVVKYEGNTDLPVKLPINIDSIQVETLGYSTLSFEVDKNKNKIEVFLSKPGSNLLENEFYVKGNKIKITNGLILEKQ